MLAQFYGVRVEPKVRALVVHYVNDQSTGGPHNSVTSLRDQMIKDQYYGSHGRIAYESTFYEEDTRATAPRWRVDFIVRNNPSGGTWQINYRGNQTANLSPTISPQDLENTLRALHADLSNVTVTLVTDTACPVVHRTYQTLYNNTGDNTFPFTATHTITGGQCAGEATTVDVPHLFDYQKMYTAHNVASRVNNPSQIDEVWVYTGGYSGLGESVVTGNGTVSNPGSNIAENNAALSTDRMFAVMGLNWERGFPEQLESYGHRAESIIIAKYGSGRQCSSTDAYSEFEKNSKRYPGCSRFGVGDAHNPFNSAAEYDRCNATLVGTNNDQWYSFPFHQVTYQLSERKDAWSWVRSDCTQAYLVWWYKHMPHVDLTFQGVGGDWWRYIAIPPYSAQT